MVTEGLGSYPCRVPRAARLVDKGDCIIIMSFDVTDEPVEPENNPGEQAERIC